MKRVAVPNLQTQDAQLKSYADAVKANIDQLTGQIKNAEQLQQLPASTATLSDVIQMLNAIIRRINGT